MLPSFCSFKQIFGCNRLEVGWNGGGFWTGIFKCDDKVARTLFQPFLIYYLDVIVSECYLKHKRRWHVDVIEANILLETIKPTRLF